MTKFIQEIIKFSWPLLIGLIALMLYNVYQDPFGVIKGDMKKQITEPNQHYLKLKHLIDHPSKYNAYLFGSSRVAKIDTRKINDGLSWYNMTYSGGIPSDHLQDLKDMLHHGIEIKKVLIGLDNISFTYPPSIHHSQYLHKTYKSPLNPLLTYLFVIPSLELMNVRDSLKKSNFQIYYDIYNSGIPLISGKEDWIDNHVTEHINNPKFSSATDLGPVYRVKESIDEVNEIYTICTNHGISLQFFINPIHITSYLNTDSLQFFEFQRKLAHIQAYYDFSGVNEITTNNINYFETIHYRPLVGDTILHVLFDSAKPPNFYYCTKENIDSVISVKKQKRTLYLSHIRQE